MFLTRNNREKNLVDRAYHWFMRHRFVLPILLLAAGASAQSQPDSEAARFVAARANSVSWNPDGHYLGSC
jgi:hypothetical protein